jgi:virulence factor Mce-like protein
VNRRNAEKRSRVAATIATIVILVATYFAFVKGLPFQGAYEVKAAFRNVNQLEKEDEVRIAGIRVGSVTDVQPGPDNTSVATMKIDDRRVAIHVDATASIRSRLLLEGNDRVELSPGSPAAPELESGDTLPVTQTDSGVQLDQALNVLDRPSRAALTDSMGALAQGLGGKPDASTPPGSTALRQAVRELDGALGSITVVSHAAKGTQTGDLRRAVASTGDFAAALAEDPRALADIVTNYNRTFGALAARDAALGASVRGFDALVRSAPPDLVSIEEAMPVLAEFARAVRPSVQALPTTLRDFDDVLVQLDGISRQDELPALLDRLHPVTAGLPGLQNRLESSFRQVTPAMQCISRRVIPVLNEVVPDGINTTGRPVWQDLAHAFAGFAGLASSFDGNGSTVRLGITESEGALEGVIPGFGRLSGLGPELLGVSPVWLGYGVDPPYRPDEPCLAQEPPDLSKRQGGPPPPFTRRPLPSPSRSQRNLVNALLTPEGRRGLLRRMIAGLDLPVQRRSRAPKPARPAPARKPPATAPAPVKTPAAGKKPLDDIVKLPDLPIVDKTLDETLGGVQDVLDRLGLGRLGGRP